MELNIYPKKHNFKWRWDGEDNDYIIYQNPFSGVIDILNPVAAQIFINCNGRNSVLDIRDIIKSKFENCNNIDISSDIELFLDYMIKEKLIFSTK